jgi:hypothetical protein
MTSHYAISDIRFTTYIAHSAERIGDPEDTDRVDWFPVEDLPKLNASGLTR